MSADPIDTPCRHGDSVARCVPCLNDEIEGHRATRSAESTGGWTHARVPIPPGADHD